MPVQVVPASPGIGPHAEAQTIKLVMTHLTENLAGTPEWCLLDDPNATDRIPSLTRSSAGIGVKSGPLELWRESSPSS